MRREDISKGVGDIHDRHVTEAAGQAKRRFRPLWMGAVAAVLAAAILCGVLFWPGGGAMKSYAVAVPEYPEMAPYPSGEWDENGYEAWWESRRAQRQWEVDLGSSLEDFCAATMPEFLGGGGKNAVYSPLNLYLALGMLAECTGGNSRAQILDLLGAESMEALRSNAAGLWNRNYCDDGALTSVLASSLWLNQDIRFKQETMDTLAKTYYASSYRGEMGSEGFNKEFQNWLNEQTRGLLTEQAGDIELDAETILALAATVYFNAKWGHEFDKEDTTRGMFHAASGDVEADFMRQTEDTSYYWGERFSAVQRWLETGAGMWFFLPDEGVEAEALLSDPEVLEIMFGGNRADPVGNSKLLIVHETIPRFDVSGSLDLSEGLQALGVTDVFDAAASDFSPMTDDVDEVYLSQATHAARVKVDEEGVEAAAFTVFDAAGGSRPPTDEVDFVLDRPFLFVLNGLDGTPLFIGIVNTPNG